MEDVIPGPAPAWGEIKVLKPSAGGNPSRKVAQAGVLSILFADFAVGLATTDPRLVDFKSSTFEVPLELPSRLGLHGVLADLRYSPDTEAGGRGVLWIAVGNATKTVEFPYDEPTIVDAAAPAPHERSLLLFDIDQRPADTQVAPAPPRPRPLLVVSIMLLGQRRTVADQVLLQVNTLDLTPVWYDAGGAADAIDV